MACKKIEIGNKCPLEAQCIKKRNPGECKFTRHFETLRPKSGDPPLVRDVKERMRKPFKKNWENYVTHKESGKKRMTGGTFEGVLREVLKEKLARLGVNVWEPGRLLRFEKLGFYIIPDCLIEKEGCPRSIISAKTSFGAEQVRETFAYAYFAKNCYRGKDIRVFMAIFDPAKPSAKLAKRKVELEKACKPYIDGIYWLSREPYIDTLYDELCEIYDHKSRKRKQVV